MQKSPRHLKPFNFNLSDSRRLPLERSAIFYFLFLQKFQPSTAESLQRADIFSEKFATKEYHCFVQWNYRSRAARVRGTCQSSIENVSHGTADRSAKEHCANGEEAETSTGKFRGEKLILHRWAPSKNRLRVCKNAEVYGMIQTGRHGGGLVKFRGPRRTIDPVLIVPSEGTSRTLQARYKIEWFLPPPRSLDAQDRIVSACPYPG